MMQFLLMLIFMLSSPSECVLVANIQPDETEQRVEYTDPQGRELCRLKIYLHDRTVIGFAPPGGEHGGYAASFNGAHVSGHRTDSDVDLISHAQVFAVENSVPPTETQPAPTDTQAPTLTPTRTGTPPDNTPTWTATVGTGTHLPPTLIPPVEITPTPSDTPTVDIYYPPPQEGKSPPAPRLPTTGMDGSNGDFWVILFATVFIGFLIILMWRGRRNR